MNDSELSGQVAIVTGGTRGIGLAIARALSKAGALVTVCGRSEAAIEGLKSVPCDLRDPDAARALIDQVTAEHGRLDILVNNAGGSPGAPLGESSPRLAERILALNLMAPIYLSQAAYPHMRERGGVIVNVASVSGVRPSPGTAVYGAAKAGLISLGRSLAHEWGPAIRVNSIVVGYVETENTAATYGDASAQAAISRNIASGRLARADEIAAAALFLVSPAASYVNGAALEVHGGGERPPFLDIVREAAA